MTEDNRSLIVDSLSTLIADEAVKNDYFTGGQLFRLSMPAMNIICLCIRIIMMFA